MIRLTLLAAAAVLLVPDLVPAADHEAPGPLTSVWIVVPKAGQAAEFETAVEDYMAWRAGVNDSRVWNVYTPVVGHNLNVYQFRSCCHQWADQDAYVAEANEKGFGPKFGEMVGPYVDHLHRYFEYNDWENSHWPDDESTAGPYYGVTTWTWKMGVGPGPENARKELSQMAIAEGWGEAGNHWIWLSRVGGKSTLAVVTPFSDYADMQPPEQSFFDFISDKMGSEEAAEALFTQFGAGFSDSDYTVWWHRPELSSAAPD
ncbi:MAG: hypothetical protein R3176_05185 [Woeseiaceae bacterium]|nr:hypothetical protein [Woeseiaceae bacterium]